jgi:hypothetical protein
MANLENNWVGYVTRSFEQIKSDILKKLPLAAPEITDHTENNILIRMISIWAGLLEMLGYYTDNSAREAHLSTARLFKSAVKIARTHDYRVMGRLAASVNLTFTLDNPAPSIVTIPGGTEVTTEEGIKFFTDSVTTIAIGLTEVTIGATQKEQVLGVSLGNSTGAINQLIELSADVVDSSLDLRVNALNWTPVNTFALSLFDEEHFVGRLNEDSKLEVAFGDDINGAIPPVGLPMDVDYFITEGANGNVGTGTITTLIGVVTVPSGLTLTVTNAVRASGGVDTQSLDSIKRRVPLSIRTLFRAVTDQDFRDVSILSAGVAQADILFNCGKTTELYIAPEGGGIASQVLIDSTQDFIDERRMTTVKVTVLPAGEVRMLITADVKVLPNFSRVTTKNLVKNNLQDFLSVDNQKVFGTVKLGDIYAKIENTDGVDFSEIIVLSTVPYARPLGHITVLNWDRVLLSGNSTIKWRMQFINATQFQVFRGNNFLGIGTIGIQFNTTEIEFTVNAGAYSVSEDWEFYTYPFFGTLNLQEPSVPVGLLADFTINTTGGI